MSSSLASNGLSRSLSLSANGEACFSSWAFSLAIFAPLGTGLGLECFMARSRGVSLSGPEEVGGGGGK